MSWVSEAQAAARAEGVDPGIFVRLVRQESRGNPRARSPKGAIGFTQLLPDTAKALGVDPNDPAQNLRGGARYLRQQLDKFGSYSKALAAYNAGPGAVERYGGVPPYAETRNYVHTILRGVTPASRGGGAAPGVTTTTTSGGGVADAGQAPNVAGFLSQLLASRQQQAVATPLPTPTFAAAPPVPQGYQAPQSTVAAPAAQPDLIDAAASLIGTDASIPQGTTTTTQQGARGVSSAGGRVRVAAGANRRGANLSPGIVKIVNAISAQAGEPLTIGTGTNHNEYTVGGNVSDHWSGNAADIPAHGQSLVKLGQAALIAAGMSPEEARKQRGGLYNIPYGRHRRIQVIFNTSGPGIGDHTTHLHVGVTANR